MAKYGINSEGVEAMNQLANDLKNINGDIEENGEKLKNTVTALGEDLGIYEEQILELIGEINRTQKNGRAAIQQLSEKIRNKAIQIETLTKKLLS